MLLHKVILILQAIHQFQQSSSPRSSAFSQLAWLQPRACQHFYHPILLLSHCTPTSNLSLESIHIPVFCLTTQFAKVLLKKTTKLSGLMPRYTPGFNLSWGVPPPWRQSSYINYLEIFCMRDLFFPIYLFNHTHTHTHTHIYIHTYIHTYIYICISIWLMDVYFILWVIIKHHFIFCSDCLSFGHWKFFQLASGSFWHIIPLLSVCVCVCVPVCVCVFEYFLTVALQDVLGIS